MLSSFAKFAMIVLALMILLTANQLFPALRAASAPLIAVRRPSHASPVHSSAWITEYSEQNPARLALIAHLFPVRNGSKLVARAANRHEKRKRHRSSRRSNSGSRHSSRKLKELSFEPASQV
jgi:hypothetical protein